MAENYDRREGRKVIRNITISVPERGPKEDSITPNQMAYIQRLAPDFQPDGGLQSLGKWQASSVIDQIKQAKGDLEYDIASGNVRGNSGLVRKSVIIAIIVLFLAFLYLGAR